MRKVILWMLMATFMVSCGSKMKNYTYTSHGINRLGNKETKTEVITALSDSLAFIEAYERRFITEQVFYDMQVLLKDTASYRDLGFTLTDETGKDILSVPFAGRDSIVSSLYNEIVVPVKAKYESMLAEMEGNRVKVEKLKPYFSFRKDEFGGQVWVEPKDAPQYVNVNGIYCYFMLVDGKPSNLRFKIQYRADDWLFIQSYKFLIDGNTYDYVPDKVERDNESYIWEWSDTPVSVLSESLLNSLSKAKTAKIRFVGRQYHKDKDITAQQIASIKRTLELYYALGGKVQ